ncbi:MAG: CDP-alcohol phosphatidyltransferase family protein [Leptospiraceae bacterium]|nr:CDP-alcohol phosphatidyltransferase family protein [Leptospiraceae bacterium]MCP5511370.1 CDP-alcohol phosphatidyltransferase family protein [Leptospiraceae bacterium]
MEPSETPGDSILEIRQKLLSQNFFNLPNFVSSLRVFSLPLITLTAKKFSFQPDLKTFFSCFLIYNLAAFSDLLDGYLARKLKKETVYGKYMDPICDKIFNLVLLLLISNYFQMPIFVFFLILIRESLGVFVGTYLFFKLGIQGNPNLLGKVSIVLSNFVIGWHLISYAFPLFYYQNEIRIFLIGSMLLSYVIGSGLYLKDFFRKLSEKENARRGT